MDRVLETTIARALDVGDFPTAHMLALQHSDPQGCTVWVETFQQERRREAYIARVRALWHDERQQGRYNPPDELGRDLHGLSLADLETLGRAIRARVDAGAGPGRAAAPAPAPTPAPTPVSLQDVGKLPRLAAGWQWVQRYQARHAEYGTTRLYRDLRACVQEINHRTPARQRVAPPSPAAEDTEAEMMTF